MTARPGHPFLSYGRQVIEEDDIAEVAAIMRGDWLTTGPAVRAFEQAVASRLGAEYAISCTSGTAALHLATLTLGLRPGDAVIVPTLTFAATANAVRFVGAEVVFADVDPDTGLMREEDVTSAIERHRNVPIKALFPVHLNGQSPPIEKLRGLAAGQRLSVIEDGCHAFGTTYRTSGNHPVSVGNCCHSDMTVFSFHPVKAITMGEGGVVTTNDPALHQRIVRLRNHGIVKDARDFEQSELAFDSGGQPNPWYYELQEIGFNYRASDLNCALGLSQLRKLDRFTARRRNLVARYDLLLEKFAPVVQTVGRVEDCDPSWHLYVALIDFGAAGIDRATIMRRLHKRGVGSQVHYMPVHLHPYYRRRYGTHVLPGAQRYYQRCLSLPLHHGMEIADVDRVVEALTHALDLRASVS